MSKLPETIAVEVRCTHLLANWEGHPVYLAVQKARAVEQCVPGSAGKATFHLSFRVTEADGTPNFLGPYAQGTRDERFFYLSWGISDSPASFGMFRRLKVHLSHLTGAICSLPPRRTGPSASRSRCRTRAAGRVAHRSGPTIPE